MGDRFFVVPAAGHFGDRSVVASSHRTLEAAQKACREGFEVRVGNKIKGEAWFRSAIRDLFEGEFRVVSC